MFIRSSFALVFVAVLASLAGCSVEDEDPGMKVEKGCLRTRCDVQQEQSARYCSQCLSLCSGASFDCDPSERCKLSCGDSPSCSDSDRESCSLSGFKATLPTTKSEAVAVACRKMFERATSCGLTMPGRTELDCDVWAKTEKPEVAASYECNAALPCEDDGAACERPVTDFGDRLCDALSATCEEDRCTADQRAALNHAGGWLKEGVQAAGLACAAQATCGDASQCITVWATAAKL